MKTPIIDRDLTKQAPHSPRERYDCPMDNQIFSFKGITGAQFKAAVEAAKYYEDVGAWLLANGTEKTVPEIEDWSDDQEAGSMMKNPEERAFFTGECKKLGLNPEKSTTFDWLEADDRASFKTIAA